MQIFLCLLADYFETDGFLKREGIPKWHNSCYNHFNWGIVLKAIFTLISHQ